jgi:hypothetical protein
LTQACPNRTRRASVCEHELEGVVAKRRAGRYVSGDRGWVKTKNRDYWRYEMEREAAFSVKGTRPFVHTRLCLCTAHASMTEGRARVT